MRAFADAKEWRDAFAALSRAQVEKLRRDVSVRAQLERDGLGVVWRSWSDAERAFDSAHGQEAAHNHYTGEGGIGSVRALEKVVAVRSPPLGPVSLSPESSSCSFAH